MIDSCLMFVGEGDDDVFIRFAFDDDDLDDDDVDECEPGDVATFGLFRVVSSLSFGDVCSFLIVTVVFGIFPIERSRSIICSCCCCWDKRNELRKCSRWRSAAAIAGDESRLGKRLGDDGRENNDA